MEEINIYHSLKGKLLAIAICLVFTVIGIVSLCDGKGNSCELWVATILFGFGGLFMLLMPLCERLFNLPVLTITNDRVISRLGRRWEAKFADIKQFDLVWRKAALKKKMYFINIHYKPDIERQEEAAGRSDRLIHRLNKRLFGSREVIDATDLTIHPEELCDLLNKRI